MADRTPCSDVKRLEPLCQGNMQIECISHDAILLLYAKERADQLYANI